MKTSTELKSLNQLTNWRTIRWLTRVSRLHCDGNSMHRSTRVNSCMSAARSWHDICSNVAFHCILTYVTCSPSPSANGQIRTSQWMELELLGRTFPMHSSVHPAERLAKLSSFFVGVSLPACGLVAFISDSQCSCVRSAVNVTDTHILKCASSSRIALKGIYTFHNFIGTMGQPCPSGLANGMAKGITVACPRDTHSEICFQKGYFSYPYLFGLASNYYLPGVTSF